MKIEQLYQLFSKNKKVDTDTRSIRKGSLFFALKGDHFNGNSFAHEALIKGAEYAIVDEDIATKDKRVIRVDDVLKTLQKLALYHRKVLDLPILALTGSNGKTTSKELINALLSKKYKTVATSGNLNNHIGVPLTLLSFDKTTEFGIVEMGANHLKEIEFLCSICQPNFGYITNFGKAHLEGFGSLDGVVEGKTELYSYLRASSGLVFINSEDQTQVERATGIPSISFSKNDFPLIQSTPFVTVQMHGKIIKSKLTGAYNYENIVAALRIANYFGLSQEGMKSAIENYIPKNNRSQMISIKNHQVLLDVYNANPSSMVAALTNFSKLKGSNKIVILGDMFELGADSAFEHQAIVDLALDFNFDKVYLIGKAFSATRAKNALTFSNFSSFKQAFDATNLKESLILIKGSRGMSLERVLDLI